MPGKQPFHIPFKQYRYISTTQSLLARRKTLRRTIRSIVKACSRGEYDITPSYPPTVEDVNIVQDAVVIIASHFKNMKILAKL